ncbi:MAG: amino acid deaminase/aldolase, partial [Actinomycetota bacterium]|nr:amino acid deaminase/aldolase [Actinomycetota bacterium]
VWLRHAKAGEVMERVAEVALVSGPADAVVVGSASTYRGEGLTFG